MYKLHIIGMTFDRIWKYKKLFSEEHEKMCKPLFHHLIYQDYHCFGLKRYDIYLLSIHWYDYVLRKKIPLCSTKETKIKKICLFRKAPEYFRCILSRWLHILFCVCFRLYTSNSTQYFFIWRPLAMHIHFNGCAMQQQQQQKMASIHMLYLTCI